MSRIHVHTVHVIDILQARAVKGYTRGSYSIRSRGADEASNGITAECIPYSGKLSREITFANFEVL